MSSRNTDLSKTPTNKKAPQPKIVAFPSLSSSLSSLPNARSLSNVALHSSTYAHNAAPSEAKLKAALANNAANPCNPSALPAYMSVPSRASSPDSSNSPIMMRSKSRK